MDHRKLALIAAMGSILAGQPPARAQRAPDIEIIDEVHYATRADKRRAIKEQRKQARRNRK